MTDGCPYDCDVKDDVAEIRKDVKTLLAHHNERKGAIKVLNRIGKGTAIAVGLVLTGLGIYFKTGD